MSTLFTTPVREYMSRTLVAVRPSTKLDEVQALFEEHDISAVPIIDVDGALCGIISTTDLLRVARIVLTTPGDLAQITAPPHSVADVMRTDVVTVDESAPVREAAEKMFRHRIHRVVVLRHGKVVGVLSTRDAMRAVLFHHIETPLGRVMSEPVVTIGLADTIKSAIGRLEAANVRGLVVVDEQWPVGVFTHTEAIKARALPPTLLGRPVEEVMSYETICMNVSTPLFRVASQAIQMRARRILAVEHRELRGVVTGFDLVRIMTLDEA